MSIYDPEKTKEYVPGSHDDLGVSPEERDDEAQRLENLYNSSPDEDAGEDPQPQGWWAGRKHNKDIVDPRHLKNQEENPDTTANGPSTKDPEQFLYSGRLGKGETKNNKFWNRKRAAIAGTVFGAGLGGSALFFSSMLPLKVMHITTNIQNTFYSSFDNSADKMSRNLLRHYIVRKVVPGMVKGKCPSTAANKSCAVVGDVNSPVEALYRAWRDANLEGTLAKDYGFEIRREGNNFYIRANTKGFNENIDLGNFDGNTKSFEGKAFAQLDRSDIRRLAKTALSEATLSKQIRYRYSVGKLLERKYGIRRCLVACTAVDKLDTSVENKKNAIKAYLAERLLKPFDSSLSLAFQCVIDGSACADLDPSNEKGERLSKYQKDINARFLAFRATHGTSKLDDVLKGAVEIREKGFARYLVEKTVGGVAGKTAGKAIPLVGWIDFFAKIIGSAQTIGPTMKHINYAMNSAAMVQLFSMYRTHADEIKSGNMDMTIAGSIAGSFEANPANDQGGAAMDASPAWNAYYGPSANARSVASGGLPFLGSVAYAEAEAKTRALCDDGNPYPQGALVCPEVALGTKSLATTITSYISDAANSPLMFFPGMVAGLWNNSVGKVLDWISSNLVGGLMSAVNTLMFNKPAELSESIMSWVMDNLFKKMLIVPVTEKMSGARTIELTMGGGAVSGAEAARYVQGGKALTSAEAAVIRTEQDRERREIFDSKPFYARLFDRSDERSFVSRVAVATPVSRDGILISLITMPNKLSLANFFVTPRAQAAIPTTNPWGVTEYGYAANDPVFTQDPAEYWETHDCKNADNVQKWGDKATRVNENTGIAEQDTTNGCMLIASEVSSNGGKYDDNLLDKSGVAAPVASQSSSEGTQATSDGQFALPVDKKYFASNPGWFSKPHHDYPAADIPVPQGTPIYALTGGKIISAPVGGACGLGVLIDSGSSIRITYCHGTDGGSVPGAKQGDTVKAGQLIMHAGNTGHSFGAHLHLQIKSNGTLVCPQNLLTAIGKGTSPLPAINSLPKSGCSN